MRKLVIFFLIFPSYIITHLHTNELTKIEKYHQQFQEFCNNYTKYCTKELVDFSRHYVKEMEREHLNLRKEIDREIEEKLQAGKKRRLEQRKQQKLFRQLKENFLDRHI